MRDKWKPPTSPPPRADAIWNGTIGWMVPIAAIAAERDACAMIAAPPTSEPSTPEARLSRTVREMLAAAIRVRGQT